MKETDNPVVEDSYKSIALCSSAGLVKSTPIPTLKGVLKAKQLRKLRKKSLMLFSFTVIS